MIRNLRDLGGLVTEDGRRVKKNMLFRSALLAHMDEEDKRWMKEVGIKYIYDLRSSVEVYMHPDVIVEGVLNINHYLQDDFHDAFSYRGMLEGIRKASTDDERLALIPPMESIYIAMVELDFCRERFAGLIRNILQSDDGAVLFHCTSGKDRTGMTAATLLSILGVPKEAIFKEYLLTAEHAKWEFEFRKKEFIKQGLSEKVAEGLGQFYVVKESFLEAFFASVEKRRGDILSYIREDLQVSDESIARFRDRLLE